MQPRILIIPGLGNSGPQHWQTLWEAQLPGSERVMQRDFDNAVCSEWIETMDAAIRRHNDHVLLVGHSSGSQAIAHWAKRYGRKIPGAFIVAPSDVERPDFPYKIVGFAPIALNKLPFPSVVVASSEDQYVTLDRAKQFATAWGSEFVNIGPAGHINAASGHGPWPEGLAMFRNFIERISSKSVTA